MRYIYLFLLLSSTLIGQDIAVDSFSVFSTSDTTRTQENTGEQFVNYVLVESSRSQGIGLVSIVPKDDKNYKYQIRGDENVYDGILSKAIVTEEAIIAIWNEENPEYMNLIYIRLSGDVLSPNEENTDISGVVINRPTCGSSNGSISYTNKTDCARWRLQEIGSSTDYKLCTGYTYSNLAAATYTLLVADDSYPINYQDYGDITLTCVCGSGGSPGTSKESESTEKSSASCECDNCGSYPYCYGKTLYYYDNDGDGYGIGNGKLDCGPGSTNKYTATNNGDCDDNDRLKNPGITCNTVCGTTSCDCKQPSTYYRDADGDGKGNPNDSKPLCHSEDGWVDNADDCDDNDNKIESTVPDIITNKTICNGDSYLWNGKHYTQKGAYKIYGGDCEADEILNLSVNTKPSATISGTSSICIGSSTTLTASCDDCTYSWNTGATTRDITVTPTSNKEYKVTVIKNGCSASAIKTVSVKSAPSSTISGATSICSGSSTTLSAPSCIGCSYSWSTGSSSKSITVSPTSTKTYAVTVTQNGCSSSSSKQIEVKDKPSSVITASSSSICPGTSSTLSVPSCTSCTYKWSTNATTRSITVKPTSTKAYTVTVTQNGCSSSSSKQIEVKDKPSSVIIASSSSICPGSSSTLSAPSCTSCTYNWSTNATTRSITVKPTSTKAYTVIVTQNGCSSSSSKQIEVKDKPSSVITASSSSICPGSSSTLSVPSCTSCTYNWSTNATTRSITVKPTSTKAYTVTVTQNGCSSSSSKQIEVKDKPSSVITASSSSICSGSSSTLSVPSCTSCTYKWSTNATTRSITVKPTSTKAYTVTVTQNGCSSSSSKQIEVKDKPSSVITASSSSICSGSSSTLSVPSCTSCTYKWSTNATTRSITVSPTSTKAYTVTVTQNGCSSSSSKQIEVKDKPSSVITASSSSICSGSSSTLSVPSCTSCTYKWSTNATTRSITVSPTSTKTYTVTVTQNGCSSSSSKQIEVKDKPSSVITASGSSICPGSSSTLSVPSCTSCTYNWSTNATTRSITVKPTSTTTYAVTVTQNGCSNGSNKTITVKSMTDSDCLNCVPNTSCNDGEVCTINDKFDTNCNCVGTFQDTDNDEVCDAEDLTNGNCSLNGSCDDNDACTINDKYDADCNCIGIIQDTDNDEICNANDNCPTTSNANQADLDNDGIGDVCDTDDDGDGISDAEDCYPRDASKRYRPGDNCDDGDPNTFNDQYGSNCICKGNSCLDEDNDGICNDADNCPTTININQADLDNDGIGDVCDTDDDGDGVPDTVDCHPRDSFKSYKQGDSCDDGDLCTINDRYDSNCNCSGTFQDNDGDGECAYYDCNDFNAKINSSAKEICGNGIDEDCSGGDKACLNCPTDTPCGTYPNCQSTTTFYRDRDRDGYGDASFPITSCISLKPNGYVINGSDCDDTNATINPNSRDICGNGIDEDCNGEDCCIPPAIIEHSNRYYTSCIDVISPFDISVEAEGTNPTYQWELRIGQSAFSDISGATGTDFSYFPSTVGYHYLRCRVSSPCGTTYSETFVATVTSGLIVGQNRIEIIEVPKLCADVESGGAVVYIRYFSHTAEYDFGNGYFSSYPYQFLPNGSYVITIRELGGCSQSYNITIDTPCTDILEHPCYDDQLIVGELFNGQPAKLEIFRSPDNIELQDIELNQQGNIQIRAENKVVLSPSFKSTPGTSLKLDIEDCPEIDCPIGLPCDDQDYCTTDDRWYYDQLTDNCLCAGQYQASDRQLVVPDFGLSAVVDGTCGASLISALKINPLYDYWVSDSEGNVIPSDIQETTVFDIDFETQDYVIREYLDNVDLFTHILSSEDRLCASEEYCLNIAICGEIFTKCATVPCIGSYSFDVGIGSGAVGSIANKEGGLDKSNPPTNCIPDDEHLFDIVLNNLYGGTGPYTFEWSTGDVTNVPRLEDVSIGIYSVTITDANGCIATYDDLLIDAPIRAIQTKGITKACPGFENGAIEFTIINPNREPVYWYLDKAENATNEGTGFYLGREELFSHVIDHLSADTDYDFIFNIGGCIITKSINIGDGEFDKKFNEHKDGVCYFDEYCGDILIGEKSYVNQVVCNDPDGVSMPGGLEQFLNIFTSLGGLIGGTADCELSDCYCTENGDFPIIYNKAEKIGEVSAGLRFMTGAEYVIAAAQLRELNNFDVAQNDLNRAIDGGACALIGYCPLNLRTSGHRSTVSTGGNNASNFDKNADGCDTYDCGAINHTFCIDELAESLGLDRDNINRDCSPVTKYFTEVFIDHEAQLSNEEYKNSSLKEEIDKYKENDNALYESYGDGILCARITYCEPDFELLSFVPISFTNQYCNGECAPVWSRECDKVVEVGEDLVSKEKEVNCLDGLDNDDDGLTDCEDLDCFEKLFLDKNNNDESLDCLAPLEEEILFIEENMRFFEKLGISSLELAILYSRMVQNPFDKEVEEKQSCINIISSSASKRFSHSPLVGTPKRLDVYPNENADIKGGDLSHGKYSIQEAVELLSPNNQHLIRNGRIDKDLLWKNVHYLFNLLTVRGRSIFGDSYKSVADRFIDKFKKSEGGMIVDTELNRLLSETSAFKNDVKDFAESFSCELIQNECTSDGCISYLPPSNILRNDDFRFVYSQGEGYVFKGPFILINDTENIEYRLESFDGDLRDGKWRACFSISSVDFFGLDTEDMMEFQDKDEFFGLGNIVGIGSGIASWWILQHVCGFKPFENVMLFEVCVEGDIGECDCEN